MGDRNPDAIYLAVGRALSKWEGVEVEMGTLFAVFTGGIEPWHYIPAARAYGSVISSNGRAEMMAQAAEAFFRHFEMEDRKHSEEIEPLKAEFKNITKAYNGWSSRRNDVAHGYVTESQHPDYHDDQQPIISTYQLFPSHGSSRKWPIDWEPNYKYVAKEIDSFGVAFEALDERVSEYAARLEVWRKDQVTRGPTG
jgi:hypothetical protein